MALTQTVERHSEIIAKSKFTLLKFLVIVFPLWLSAKMYSGPYNDEVNNYLSLILGIIACALVVQMIFPRASETPLLISLFVIFSAFEAFNHFYPSTFEEMTLYIGPVPVLGTGYSLHMIPYYGVGVFIGYFILKACRKEKK